MSTWNTCQLAKRRNDRPMACVFNGWSKSLMAVKFEKQPECIANYWNDQYSILRSVDPFLFSAKVYVRQKLYPQKNEIKKIRFWACLSLSFLTKRLQQNQSAMMNVINVHACKFHLMNLFLGIVLVFVCLLKLITWKKNRQQ